MRPDDDWLWIGERACLDFVNTARGRWAEPRETLQSPDDLRRWLRTAELLDHPGRPTDRDVLERARQLRETIDHAVRTAAAGHVPRGPVLAVINEFAREAPPTTRQLAIRNQQLVERRVETPPDDLASGLGLVAADAIDLLLSPEIGRVRICGGDRCGLRFVDRSPARNRRWCSMARCGNRAKAKSHYARHRDD